MKRYGVSQRRAQPALRQTITRAKKVRNLTSSFAFFAAGAAVPVLPFLLPLEGVAALVTAMVLVGVALMLTGATVGVLSGGPPLRRALRQLAIGAGAAGVTFLLGLLVGAALG